MRANRIRVYVCIRRCRLYRSMYVCTFVRRSVSFWIDVSVGVYVFSACVYKYTYLYMVNGYVCVCVNIFISELYMYAVGLPVCGMFDCIQLFVCMYADMCVWLCGCLKEGFYIRICV